MIVTSGAFTFLLLAASLGTQIILVHFNGTLSSYLVTDGSVHLSGALTPFISTFLGSNYLPKLQCLKHSILCQNSVKYPENFLFSHKGLEIRPKILKLRGASGAQSASHIIGEKRYLLYLGR
jgi:hypothetical protein